MAENLSPYAKNIGGKKQLILLEPYAAGSSQAVKRGEWCEKSGGNWTPITGDDGWSGTLALSHHEITASHLAGYYPLLVPQPGDLFHMELAAANAAARGASLYYSTSQKFTTTAGSNPIGEVFDHSGFPLQQGNGDVGDVADRGTTVNTADWVLCTILAANSFYAQLQG